MQQEFAPLTPKLVHFQYADYPTAGLTPWRLLLMGRLGLGHCDNENGTCCNCVCFSYHDDNCMTDGGGDHCGTYVMKLKWSDVGDENDHDSVEVICSCCVVPFVVMGWVQCCAHVAMLELRPLLPLEFPLPHFYIF